MYFSFTDNLLLTTDNFFTFTSSKRYDDFLPFIKNHYEYTSRSFSARTEGHLQRRKANPQSTTENGRKSCFGKAEESF
jgi:hypothetical protein